MQAKVSSLIKADFEKVFEAIQYENVSKWSRKFRLLEVVNRSKNAVEVKCPVRVMGIKYQVSVKGVWTENSVNEEILLSDGTVTKETVTCVPVPGGTRVDWTGEIIKFGRTTKVFGPLLAFFFKLDVKRDFKKLSKYLNS